MAVDVVLQMKDSLWSPLIKALQNTLAAIPGLLYAVIILLVGYLIAIFVGALVEKVLKKIKFNKWVLEKTKIKPHTGAVNLSDLAGLVTKWYVFILFLPPAADIIGLKPLAMFLSKLAEWIPMAIVAILIGLIGFIVADYVALKVKKTKAKGCGPLAGLARVVILVFTAMLVLDQLGVEISIAKNSFLIIIGGMMFGLALAFGLGMKGEVKKWLSALKKKVK